MGRIQSDRVRLSTEARIVVLKAIRTYIISLLETKDKESENWPEAMDGWKIAKALAEREPGRRVRWSVDWYYSFDKKEPISDLDGWIKGLARK